MHKLPVIKQIMDVVLKHAEKHQVKKVIAVHLQVGELSDLEDQCMQQYFDYLFKGGIVEGARLVIERMPVVMKCSDCGMTYAADIRKDGPLVCPSCSSEKKELISGRGYFIKNLEAI